MANAEPRRRPSQADIGKMKVSDLREALRAAVGELEAYDEIENQLTSSVSDADDTAEGRVVRSSSTSITGMLQMILKELKVMRAERSELTRLRQECTKLKGCITQQRFLEQLDARDRQQNLIVTGVPEDGASLDGATTDREKCNAVLSTIGVTGAQLIDVRRLGKPDRARRRPILLKVASKARRDEILANTKVLKERDAFKKIYVKKDLHPAVRNEWKRLRDVESAEKRKPENQGCSIELDYISREVKRDDVVIDSWSPTYFQ